MDQKGEAYYRLRFSEILAKEKLISNVDLFKIMQVQREGSTESFGQIAINKGIITQEQLANVYKKYFHISTLSLKKRKILDEMAYLLPVVLLRKYNVFPLQFTSSKKLALGMINPLDVQAIKHIESLTRYKIKPIFCSEEDIKEKIEAFHSKKPKQPEVFQDEKFVPLDPKEAMAFFNKKGEFTQKIKINEEKNKNEEKAKAQKASGPMEEDIVEVSPLQVKSQPEKDTNDFWGESPKQTSPQEKPPPKPVASELKKTNTTKIPPTPPGAILAKTTEGKKVPQRIKRGVADTKKVRVMDFNQPLTRKIEAPLDAKARQKTSSFQKLTPMGSRENSQQVEDPTSHKTFRLKPMPDLKPMPGIVSMEPIGTPTRKLEPLKKKEVEPDLKQKPFSPEATQKLAELQEQLEEEVSTELGVKDNSTSKILKRKLQKIARPDLFTPIPVDVVELSNQQFEAVTQVTPERIVQRYIEKYVDLEIAIPAIPISQFEFELLED